MDRFLKFWIIFAIIFWDIQLCAGLGFLLFWNGLGPGLPILLVLGGVYGWMLYAYLHYRHGRQDEFLHLLSTAVEAQTPLASALHAYVQDRPQGPARDFWVAVVLFFVMPGYYWVWHRRHNFDSKIAQVAYLLDEGYSLTESLKATPGVASPETLVAAAIGESSGNLALCLRASGRRRLTTIWLEMLPRLFYPLLLLSVMTGILGFWMTYIAPKLQKIYFEFKQEIPTVTFQLFVAWRWLTNYTWVVIVAVHWVVGVALFCVFSSTVRWYFPFFGRLYRMEMQSRILQMLSTLLRMGKPVPEALAVLVDSGYFARAVRRRLTLARHFVVQGETFADSLSWAGLLPAAMAPLVQTAERVGNLDWVLAELGENLANRTVRILRRLTMVLSPLVVFVIGLMIGFIVISMFVPLVNLLTGLSE
jgi:type IV pilus assembly protein PilC